MTVTMEKADNVALITLDRPEKLNAISGEMWDQLYQYFTELMEDDSTRAVILTGKGRAFCSGGDVSSMGKATMVSSRWRSHTRHRVIMALQNLEKPVICAVRGACYGIANALALACDMIVASDTAKFSMAFKRVGLVPDGGVAFFLTQYVGVGRARDLVYTGRVVEAAEALSMGLVARVVPDAELESAARKLALEFANSATHALALSKKMFQSLYSPTLETLLETEKFASTITRLTDDHKEAVAAFKEKRPPKFTGR